MRSGEWRRLSVARATIANSREIVKLSDSEVLTIEVVGEFLGIDTDQGLYTYFRRNYPEWFPALNTVHRTTFCRQAANLWG